jgi:hypothetical protein
MLGPEPLPGATSTLMKTILDGGSSWFLDQMQYEDSTLVIVATEGLQSGEAGNLHLGNVILPAFRIEADARSRRVEIWFREPSTWQVVDESFTFYNEYEEREPVDAGRLRVLARSKYPDHFKASYAGYSVMHTDARYVVSRCEAAGLVR